MTKKVLPKYSENKPHWETLRPVTDDFGNSLIVLRDMIGNILFVGTFPQWRAMWAI